MLTPRTPIASGGPETPPGGRSVPERPSVVQFIRKPGLGVVQSPGKSLGFVDPWPAQPVRHPSGATCFTDAYVAAIAVESGCDWITGDRDFSRFPGLRWRHPIAEA